MGKQEACIRTLGTIGDGRHHEGRTVKDKQGSFHLSKIWPESSLDIYSMVTYNLYSGAALKY